MVERACNSIMEKYKQRHSHSRELSDIRRMSGLHSHETDEVYDPMSAARELAQRDISRSQNKANQLPNGQGSGTFVQGKSVNQQSTSSNSIPQKRSAGADMMETELATILKIAGLTK